VLEDGGKIIAESGAEIEYLIDTYGNGRFRPEPGTNEYWQYVEWIHYGEGSAMLPLLLALYTGMLGEGAAPLKPRVDSEIANHLSYMADRLGSRDFFVGNGSHRRRCPAPVRAGSGWRAARSYPNLVKYRARMQDRPAYQRGIEKAGPIS